MKNTNKFNQFDEVKITSQNKNGIVVDYSYCRIEDCINYLVDCEEEIIICREDELKEA